MTKIVFNNCYGGFGLSEAGVFRYAEIKGITLYPERGCFDNTTYWIVPPDKRMPSLTGEAWLYSDTKERQSYNEAYRRLTISSHDIQRTDPALVQTVEELGKMANGRYASLAIAEVPKGQRYRIDEYDGNESIMTVDDYEWFVS